MNEKQQAAYDEALMRIEQVRQQGKNGTELNFASYGLTVVPPEIGQLTALTGLSFYDNQLAMVPPEIAQLKALTLLNLGKNQLTVCRRKSSISRR